MPLKYIDPSGAIITQPSAIVSYTVQNTNSGLATSGVMTLVGEANGGPSFDQEPAGGVEKNFFGPGDITKVIAKYGSGDIVDAFNQLVVPSKDTDIQGSPLSIFIVKTNKGTQASANLLRTGQSAYAKVADLSYGRLGNSISTTLTAKNAEVAPTTAPFTYIPAAYSTTQTNTQTFGIIVNGVGAPTTSTFTLTNSGSPTSLVSPTAFQTQIAAANTSLLVTGGVDRGVLAGITGTSSLAVAVAGTTATITLSGAASAWTVTPIAGDTFVIPNLNDYAAGTASVIVGASAANAGSYIVQSATATTIVAKKVANDKAGVLVSPVAVTAVAIVTASRELRAYSPVTIQNSTGFNRNILSGGSISVTATASGQTLSLVAVSNWTVQPVIGDIAYIPVASALTGASNFGWYSVTSSGPATMTLTRLSNSTTLATVTATTAPADIQVYRPVIDGVGKTLAIYDAGVTTASTYQSIIASLYTGVAATPVTWVESASQAAIVSSVEQSMAMKDVRAVTSQSELLTFGGTPVLLVGYLGTTATLTVTSTNTLSTTVTGGVGGNIAAINFADFRTIADVASYINAQPGYAASVALAAYRTLPAYALDQGTFNIVTAIAGHTPGRIKKDAYDFLIATDNSVLIQIYDATTGYPIVLGGTLAGATGNYITALSGLPDAQATLYLAGGTLGSTSDANVVAALKACEKIRTNFVCTLFSRNAIGGDVTDGSTDPASTYTILGINTALNTHCLSMSDMSHRRNRQGFASIRDTFANAQTAAQQISSARISMNFMDVITQSVTGTIVQFQPWMGAVEEAAMQAAGFYKPVFNKLLNINGAVQAAGDFSADSQDDINSALNAGLTVIGPDDTGVSYKFLADYTTYQTDTNFVFNSVQAVYVADLIALSTARELERQFVGKSLAQISAAMILSVLAGIMKNFMRLNLITSSDGAPAGYIDASVQIAGPVAQVKFKVFEATGLYFIPISFLIAQVTQSANQ